MEQTNKMIYQQRNFSHVKYYSAADLKWAILNPRRSKGMMICVHAQAKDWTIYWTWALIFAKRHAGLMQAGLCNM